MTTQQFNGILDVWNSKTYEEGLASCKETIPGAMEYCKEILGNKGLRLLKKKMNGRSSCGLPRTKDGEGKLKEISLSGIFNELLSEGGLSPANYALKIVEACMKNNFDKEKTIGIVARSIRSFPSYMREINAMLKIEKEFPEAKVRRATPEEDMLDHADLYVNYNGMTFKCWSYVSNSTPAVINTTDKIRGKRNKLTSGLHLLMPFNIMDKGYQDKVYEWLLYNDNYMKYIKNVVDRGDITDYNDFLSMELYEQRNFIKEPRVLRVA